MASQHHAFAALPADLRGRFGACVSAICTLAQVGNTFAGRPHGNLRRGDFESHTAGSSHHFWHDGVVAGRMVATGVGPALYCGFFIHRNFVDSTTVGVGESRCATREAARPGDVGHFCTVTIFDLGDCAKGRRADF